MCSSVRSLAALLLAVAVLIYPATELANDTGGTAVEGAAAGRADGMGRTDSLLWLGAGCLGFPWGIMAAYVMIPDPPAERLLGKSPEYVAAYAEAYRASARNAQARNAWIGTAVVALAAAGVVAYVVVQLRRQPCQPIGGW